MTAVQPLALSPRAGAFRILSRFENAFKKKSAPKTPLKAENLIHEVLNSPEGRTWTPADRGLLTALTYGVLRRWLALEYSIEQLSRFPVAKIQPKAKTLLRLGLLQLRFMDQIPPYAAVNSTVELAKQQKLSPKTVSFINGILREYLRRDEKGSLQAPIWAEEPEAYLQACCGLPLWFSRQLLAQFSPDDVKAMAEVITTPPPLTLRVNTLKNSVAAYKGRLKAAEITFACPDETLPEILTLNGFYGSPRSLPGYCEGLFYVQDLRSAQVSRVLSPKAGETIVDLCAAPGSKTTHMAALMENMGTIWAVEPVKKRLEVLKENLQRLNITCVQPVLSMAADFQLPEGKLADRVLVDAPCSGLGTVRQHPEIFLQLAESAFEKLPNIQYDLLEIGFNLLKPGGILVYSTCSLDNRENQQVIQRFISAYPTTQLDSLVQHHITETGDGFFWAVFQKAS